MTVGYQPRTPTGSRRAQLQRRFTQEGLRPRAEIVVKDVTDLPRVEQLKELKNILAKAIDAGPGARDLASLVKQYREVLAEIESIEGVRTDTDEINAILTRREADGRTGAVRKSRAKIPPN